MKEPKGYSYVGIRQKVKDGTVDPKEIYNNLKLWERQGEIFVKESILKWLRKRF